MTRVMSIGAVADHFGVRPWQVRRVIQRGLLREPERVGTYRIFLPRDLRRVEAALREAGYLADEEAGVAG